MRIAASDNPAITIGLATTVSEFDVQMATLDKTADYFLHAPLGHATFGGKPCDAGPGAALALIHKISEDVCEHEGKWRQLGIGAHLVEPQKFFARE